MEEATHGVVWLGYGIAALILWALVCMPLRRLRPLVAVPVLAVLAALMLMPWSVASGSAALAPAWIVSLFDGLIQPDARFSRAGLPLGLAMAVALIAGVILGRLMERRRADSEQGTGETPS